MMATARLLGKLAIGLGMLLAAFSPAASQQEVVAGSVLAEFGTPKYPPDFPHFDYADPSAPKGGSIILSATGTFDTLNALPTLGVSVRSIGLAFDALMVEAQDDLSVYYPLIAKGYEYPADRSSITFELRPEARFQDGTPLTAENVAFTFRAIKQEANPFLRQAYADVESVTVLGPHRVRFDMATRGTMQPLVRIAGLGIQSKAWWTSGGRDIGEPTLEPILGSGPYRIVQVDPGKSIAYERDSSYWAADLPVSRGLWNFDRIRYDYYLDETVRFEAFKSGLYDLRQEYAARSWATGYDFDAAHDGRVVRAEVPVDNFTGMQGFFFNTRNAPASDKRVRIALNHLFPYEYVRDAILYGLRIRRDSYFVTETYRWTGLPEGEELALLEPFRGQVPEEVFTVEFRLPENPGAQLSRENRRRALALFEEAGWVSRDQRLVDAATGQQMRLEVLLNGPTLEPHTQPWVEQMRAIGIDASIRIVDSAQFQRRYQDRDFQVISFAYTFYPPPGAELASYFGSAAAAEPASANLMGISDPAVDSLIDTIVRTEDLEEKRAATRALDRVLLWGWYCVPHWYTPEAWVAYWDRFGRPASEPRIDFLRPNGIGFQETWWIDPAKDAVLGMAR